MLMIIERMMLVVVKVMDPLNDMDGIGIVIVVHCSYTVYNFVCICGQLLANDKNCFERKTVCKALRGS